MARLRSSHRSAEDPDCESAWIPCREEEGAGSGASHRLGNQKDFILSAVGIWILDRNLNLKQCAGVIAPREKRERTNQRSEFEEAGG